MVTKKQLPIDLDELEKKEEEEEEGQGPLTFMEEGKPRNGRGPKKPVSGPRGNVGTKGVLQVFVPILVAVVISLLMINALTVSKGDFSNGMASLQEDVTTRISTLSSKVDNIVNNYASKTELSGFIKGSDLNGYAPLTSLSGYTSVGAFNDLKAEVNNLKATIVGTPSVSESDIEALIAEALSGYTLDTSSLVTKEQMDSAIVDAVNYLRSLIGGGSVTYTMLGTGESYALLVGPGASGNYTGSVTITYPMNSSTRITSTYTSSVATFYAVTEGKYSPTISLGQDSFYYLTSVAVVSDPFSLTEGQVQYIPLKGLYGFGEPSGVVIK